MKRLLYSDAALDDLKGILDYISQDKPLAARSFIDALIDRCQLIAENPEVGMQRDELAPFLRLFTYRGYGIYYRNIRDEVLIERVLHPSLDVVQQSFGETTL